MGANIVKYDLGAKRLIIEAPLSSMDKKLQAYYKSMITPKKEVSFDYTSDGAIIMSLAASPDGTIVGGTAFPMQFFSYNPLSDKWAHRDCFGQWNTIARQDNKMYIGGYINGFLLEWDPYKVWVETNKNQYTSNPLFIAQGHPDVDRPYKLLVHPDGKTIVLTGSPGYGLTGGGLLFWNRDTRKTQVLKHTEIIPNLSTMSLVAIPERKVLGGTTILAGTGGEIKAKEAELYIMDMDTKSVIWREAVIPKAQSYYDLYSNRNDLVYGVADRKTFFVFSCTKRKIIKIIDLSQFGLTIWQQGPRIIFGDQNNIYVLLEKGIVIIDAKSYSLKWINSPVPITAGGEYLDGRIYFANGSRLYSYKISN